MKSTLLILAAGMGSRYGGMKQLDKLGPSGETIMDYSVFDGIQAGFNKIVFVIRRSFEQQFREIFIKKLEPHVEIQLAFQEVDDLPPGTWDGCIREKPWGTAHAIWTARELIREPFAVINADDFYGRESFFMMARYLQNHEHLHPNHYAMCGFRLKNTLSNYGTVSRGICNQKGNFLTSVHEHTMIGTNHKGEIFDLSAESEKPLAEDATVSMNFWGFTPGLFLYLDKKLQEFLKKHASDPKKEMYIPFVIDELIQEHQAWVEVLPCDATWFGVTYPDDKYFARQRLQELTSNKTYPLMLWP